jgi:hypothetical protein
MKVRGGGGRGIALLFNLAARLGRVVNAPPRALYPRERDPVPIVQEGGPQGRSGLLRKISPPPGFNPRTVQPVANLYTDYTNPAHR